MSTINDLYKESELALAAYGNFLAGIPDIQELTGNSVGMSATQADEFSKRWEVLAQFPDATNQTNSGVSATLFQNKLTGEISLAIRGTEPSPLDIMADGLLAVGISSKLNPQFTALKAQIDTWREAGGPLNGQTFTVTGHSLGGYLAAAVKEQYPAEATQAYLYNAPGFGGIFGELLNGIGVINAGNGSGISNRIGSEGLSDEANHVWRIAA